MQFLIVLAILMLVVLVVTAPLRRAQDPATAVADRNGAARRQELEAAREAKFREIRDADLDHRTGKLSDADFEALDEGLRAEAVEILQALDRVPPA
jgi:hypothetical protein